MREFILTLIGLALLTACSQAPEKQEPQVDPELSARQFMLRGDYTAAAEEYLALASRDSRNANTYRLKATTAYIEAGNYDQALMILKETDVEEKDSLQKNRSTILGARLELEFGQPQKAQSTLEALNRDEIPASLLYPYHDILANAYHAQGNFIAAATERITAQQFANSNQQQQNDRSLWNIFQDLSDDELDYQRQVAPESLRGWMDLASLYRTYRFDPEKLSYAIDSWSQRYPEHPAFMTIAPGLLEKSAALIQRPEHIGLLLPLSNQFKQASTAVRDGFMAAWYFDQQGRGESIVTVYDANSLNIMDVYRQAVLDGVDYVVGPLEKEAVKALLEQPDLSVPVLALNQTETRAEQPNQQLVQFGLAPEEEARQVAEVALSDGHIKALVITPDNNWGKRIAESFTERWLAAGGAVLEQVHYSSDLKDYATPVKELLNVDSSEARIAELRGKLNLRLDSRERRRQDVDFVFTASLPAEARQLLPQLRFYQADDVPIYATSHLFTGVFNSALDSDMNDVQFVDMPWILDTRRQLSLIQESLNRNASQDRSTYRRLYALGIDAYRLIPELNRLRVEQDAVLSGETGDLRLGSDNIIQRKLRRARFVNGIPELTN